MKDGDFSTATFAIKEVLKGNPKGPLVLASEFVKFKPDQEFVLCWMGENSAKGTVNPSFLDGIPEWYCLSVTTEDGNVTVEGIGSLKAAKAICHAKNP